MDQIKNIIYDLGGVIINLDYTLSEKALRKYGKDQLPPYNHKQPIDFYDDFETGHISSQEFRNKMREFLKPETSDQQIDQAWNAMLLNLPEQRIQMLKQTQKHKRQFVLSNINEIHEKEFELILKQQKLHEAFFGAFEKVYYSHHIGMRKPNLDIFQFVINENNLNPDETLFIDDSIANIEGAKKAGLQTLHHPKGSELLNLHQLLGDVFS